MTLTKKELEALMQSPFWQQCQHAVEHDEYLDVNGQKMPQAVFNLIVTRRDLTLWCNIGMKPHRHWKVTDVKKYFNITGSKETLLPRFMKIYEHIFGKGVESMAGDNQ